MEIALSSFVSQINPQFDATTSAESARQRQRAEQAAQSPSSARTANDQAAEDQRNRSRAENNSRTPQSNRVINGEVLSSETSRGNTNTREANPGFSARSSFNQQPSNQTDNRRISAQLAIQTFQENEDLISDSSNPRQVSGIIDEFV